MIPRPDRAARRAVAGAAGAAAGAVGEAADYVARVLSLLDAAERLIARTDAVMTRIEVVTATAERVVGDVERVTGAAEGQIAKVGVVTGRAESLTVRAADLVATGEGMLREVRPLMADGLPKLRRFLTDLTEEELTSMISLVDRMPGILAHVDETIIPTMRQMSDVGPDIKALLMAVEDMRDLVEAIPGMGLIRRRERHHHRDQPREARADEPRSGVGPRGET